MELPPFDYTPIIRRTARAICHALQDLRAALERGDDDRAYHLYQRIDRLRERRLYYRALKATVEQAEDGGLRDRRSA